MRQAEAPGRRVYRLGPRRRAFVLVTWALFVLPLLLGGLWMRDGAMLAAGALAGVIAIPSLVLVWCKPRLVLSAAGVVRDDFGYRLESPWENIAELRLVPGSEGFVLRAPMASPAARRFSAATRTRLAPAAVRLYPPEVLGLIAQDRFIPIEAFAYWLRRGDLARDIAARAPWLTAQ